MNIRGIIREEIGNFDWVKEHEVTYDVSEMEVGKTYQFVPDLTLLDRPDVDEAPSFVKDYGKSKFYIIKQEPQKEYITFKPIGKANRMVYDGKYTRLSYHARVFQWGRFKEIENPQMETRITESAFDWAEETPVPPIHVGGKLRTPNGNILTIDKIVDNSESEGYGEYWAVKMVHWKIFHDGSWNVGSDRYLDVEERIEDGVWTPVSDETINESDFDWAKDVPGVDIYNPQVGYIYHWKGYRDLFLGPDDDGPLSDEIVIKNIEHYEHKPNVWNKHTVYEFDTVNNYWGNTHLDGIDSRDFIRMIKDGTITFMQES
jgi:hypothetical protein